MRVRLPWRSWQAFTAEGHVMQAERFTTAAENKQLMQRIFAALAQGNGLPFVDSLADDFCHVSRRWSSRCSASPR
jgi:hypothetical protein